MNLKKSFAFVASIAGATVFGLGAHLVASDVEPHILPAKSTKVIFANCAANNLKHSFVPFAISFDAFVKKNWNRGSELNIRAKDFDRGTVDLLFKEYRRSIRTMLVHHDENGKEKVYQISHRYSAPMAKAAMKDCGVKKPSYDDPKTFTPIR